MDFSTLNNNSQNSQNLILNKLNSEQKRAVESTQGPILVLAGAGSGKTRVLTHRIAQIISLGLAHPQEVLAVTFTNKAAGEMEHRIYELLSKLNIIVDQRMWVNTFHSFCVRLLRDHIALLGYQPYFNIYDSQDQLSLIKKVLSTLNIDEKVFSAKSFQGRINNAKMLALNPTETFNSDKIKFDKLTQSVYETYENQIKSANALDFGDLLFKTYDLFRMYPDILEFYQNRFKYILVDEYQDTNYIQYVIIKMLAAKNRNLCVVGDEDQSIYSWRGADITNILNFEKDFPEAQIIKLEENYRSTKTIVNAATHMIQNNSQRKEKTLFTNNEEGELITIQEENNEYDEARFVVKNINRIIEAADGQWSDIAIFYRTNSQSRVLEEQLRMSSIPYRLVGGIKFYERLEVKDILSYMKLIMNSNDDVALKRIINTPTRGIGKTTVDRLEEIADHNKTSLWSTLQNVINIREFNAGTTGKLRLFVNLIEELQTQIIPAKMGLIDSYTFILEKTQYAHKLKLENTVEADSRLDNIEELANAISQFQSERGDDATLQNFLEEMALVSDVDSMKEEFNAVTLMTLHISKGLEFPFVFIVGLEDGLFPSQKSFDETDESSIEEERRLAYVGMTRARKQLFLTHVKMRRIWGQEQVQRHSRFLEEIPKHFVQWKKSVPNRPSFMSSLSSNGSSNNYKNYNHPHEDENHNQSFYDEDTDYFTQSSKSKSNRLSASNDNGFKKGTRVKHPTFGAGTIHSVEGSGDAMKVSIVFGDYSMRTFVAKYARLEKV